MKLNQNTISLSLLLIIGICTIVWGIVFWDEAQGKVLLWLGVFLTAVFFRLVSRDIDRWIYKMLDKNTNDNLKER